MILSSASRRSQHYSPAGSAKGRDGSSPRLRSQPTAQGTGTTPTSHELPGEQDPTPHPGWKQSRVYGLGASAPLPALPALSCCHTFHLAPCREFNPWESTTGLSRAPCPCPCPVGHAARPRARCKCLYRADVPRCVHEPPSPRALAP